MPIKIIVNGALGKMGQLAVETIKNDAELILVDALTKGDDLCQKIQQHKADVVVDLTIASAVFDNISTIISSGARPVIGTSGLLPAQIDVLKDQSAKKNLGGIIVPNFSLAATLMMKYAKDAAKYLPHVEIIEMHHDGKEDSPSGTALHTAELIAEHNPLSPPKPSKEIIPAARGATHHQIPIHSIRLPGLLAHQEIIFGSRGETLRIKHDTLNRECFIPGLLLACKKVMDLNELVVGLEHLL